MKHNKEIDYDKLIPDRLLINRADVEKICNQYINKKRAVNIIIQVILLILGFTSSYLASIIFTTTQGNNVSIPPHLKVLLIILFLLIITIIIYSWQSQKHNDILKNIYGKVIEESDHTAIFLICKNVSKDKSTQKIELLTSIHSQGGESFIVWSKLESKTEPDLNELKKRLASILEIQSESILNIHKKKTFNNIKRTSNQGHEKLIRYEFYTVEILQSVEKEINQKKTYKWKSMEELLTDIPSQIYNHDVIQFIKDNFYAELKESFISQSKYTPVKIIWNITNTCNYNCAICATNDPSRIELNVNEKAIALLSLLSIGKDSILGLDFSGGDPLQSSDSRKIIKYAIQEIGYDKVGITTTGLGIKIANDEGENLTNLLRNCEITIETAHEASTIRKVGQYSITNQFNISMFKQHIANLTINVPIVDPEMAASDIEELVDSISKIDISNKTVTLLKLMNVGRMATIEYPESYNPEKFINAFLEIAKRKHLKVKLQCALRTEFGEDGTKKVPCPCNMLNEKVGIDCAGNVFACAWGGYINIGKDASIADNPFYLGNLLEKNLSDILEDQKAFKIRNKMSSAKKKYKMCQVCRQVNYISKNN